MTEKERPERKRELTKEISQLDMKIQDFDLGDSDQPLDLLRAKAELQQQLVEFGA